MPGKDTRALDALADVLVIGGGPAREGIVLAPSPR